MSNGEEKPKEEEEETVGIRGLTPEKVEASRKLHGWNEVIIPEEPWYMVLLKCFMQPMSFMLEVSMLISGAAEEWSDFSIITTMLLVNSFLGFFEDMKAKRSVQELKSKIVNHVDTARLVNGELKYIPLSPRELVVGDIIHVRGGDAIPADCSFHSGADIQVNTAAMTGESLPVKFTENGPFIDNPGNEGKLEKKPILAGCMVHMSPGTHLKVETVGKRTIQGQAQMLIASDDGSAQSAFESKILNVTMYIIVFTLIDVIVVITVQVECRGYGFWDEITDCLSLIIASVPVALPMVIQITTALGATAMADQHAIVTGFAALQDIAGMTVLCSDKTGTLTTANITADFKKIKCYNGFTPEQVITYAAVACGNSSEDPIDKSVRYSFRDNVGAKIVDGKTVANLEEAGAILKKWSVTKVAGFTPEVKRFVAYANHPEDGEMKLAKGLLNKIMNTGDDGGDTWKCENIDALAEDIAQTDTAFAKNGYKTVGVAAGKMVDGEWKMQFAGVVPMIDPPRHDTEDVIEKLNENGIEVRMITGDHKNIAIETAKKIGLPTNILANTEIVYEKRVDESEPLMVTQESREKILSSGGFAQVMPTDKLMIVRVFRDAKGGSITGMTGDGVNDAPALKAANVGVAVKGATAAAQSAADIILTDDGLMPIYTAVVESRKIYSRLRSYVLYRIGATIQIVVVLSTLIFVFDETIPALYVILLALLNDITMLTVSYDNAREMKEPVRPTIFGILCLAFFVGTLMAASSIGFYLLGTHGFMGLFSQEFADSSDYIHGILYLQISLGIEMLIFNCREPKDPFFYSCPCVSLIVSVIFANVFVIILCYKGWIVTSVSKSDIGMVCAYDIIVFFIVDVVKVFVGRIVDSYDLENYFEGERAIHVVDPTVGGEGGGPMTPISDSDGLHFCNPDIWKMFGNELTDWIDSRSHPCCRKTDNMKSSSSNSNFLLA